MKGVKTPQSRNSRRCKRVRWTRQITLGSTPRKRHDLSCSPHCDMRPNKHQRQGALRYTALGRMFQRRICLGMSLLCFIFILQASFCAERACARPCTILIEKDHGYRGIDTVSCSSFLVFQSEIPHTRVLIYENKGCPVKDREGHELHEGRKSECNSRPSTSTPTFEL